MIIILICNCMQGEGGRERKEGGGVKYRCMECKQYPQLVEFRRVPFDISSSCSRRGCRIGMFIDSTRGGRGRGRGGGGVVWQA